MVTCLRTFIPKWGQIFLLFHSLYTVYCRSGVDSIKNKNKLIESNKLKHWREKKD